MLIKCIQNRELRRSGPIYILQEILNYQLCTVPRTVRNNLSISRTQGPETKLHEPRGAPHMGPHVWPNLQCEFQARPLPFSHTTSTGINYFKSNSQLTYRACWFPMAVSNQVVSLDRRLKQWTVFNNLISMGRTTSLASTHNFKNKPFPWLKWEPD